MIRFGSMSTQPRTLLWKASLIRSWLLSLMELPRRIHGKEMKMSSAPNTELTTERATQLKDQIHALQPHEINHVSALLTARILALRKHIKETLIPGRTVKIYTPTNVVQGKLVSQAAVNAVVRLVDGTEHKVDMATIVGV